MIRYVCLGLALLAAIPTWCQLTVIPYETSETSTNEEQMQTPPPVSSLAYPSLVASEIRANYISAGLILNTTYTDNVIVGSSIGPIGDFTYSILPTLAFDKSTPRQHLALTYSPGFTLYQHTSELDAANQTASVTFKHYLSQYITLNLSDRFQKSSNVFDQLYSPSGIGISSSAQSPSAQVIAPYANRLSNTGAGELDYQFARNAMIGASGLVVLSEYSNPEQATGLQNSTSSGGSAFYSQRFSGTQYIGMKYQYVKGVDEPLNAQQNAQTTQSEVQTHTVLAFYTIYFKPTLSLSLSGGPEYFDANQPPSPPSRSWTPSTAVSIIWQGKNFNSVISISRMVTGGTGLVGAFDTNSADTSVRWRIARAWTMSVSANYFNNKNVTPHFFSSSYGGHTISGAASMEHSLSEHVKMECGYTRLHQSYSGIPAISGVPTSNSEFISISYQLSRPLGR